MAFTYFSLFILGLAATCQATPVPDQFFTVDVPEGMTATNHSSNSIFCVIPSPWFGVAVFYLGNYASHAATVITYPGEAPFNVILTIIFALFFPTSGIIRGLGAICRHANGEKTDLRVAARAGALCHVVRTGKWREKDKTYESADWKIIEGAWTKELPQLWPPTDLWPFFDTSLEQPKAHERIPKGRSRIRKFFCDAFRTERKIHGTCILPEGDCYTLAFVPRNAIVKSIRHNGNTNSANLGTGNANSQAVNAPATSSGNSNTATHSTTPALPASGTSNGATTVNNHGPQNTMSSKVTDCEENPTVLSSSYSFVRATIAIVQILYAATTLYKATNGPQIAQYGYAAFGLTVTPYLIMSFVNLVGNLVTPSYDALYLVSSPILEEAAAEGGIFDGVVGRLVMEKGKDSKALVSIEDTNMHKTMREMSSDSGETTGNQLLETCHDHVSRFPTPSPTKTVKLCVAFNCPRFKRTDSERIPTTRAVKQNEKKDFKKLDYIPAYLNPEYRAEFPIPWYSYFFFTFSSLFIGLSTLIPIGIISKFDEDHGTHPERIWIMCWIVFGAVIGTLTGWWTAVLETRSPQVRGLSDGPRLLWRLPALIFAAPGIGGFIVVGQMLRQYGNCVSLF